MFKDDYKVKKNCDIDYILEFFNYSLNTLNYSFYIKLDELEHHFDNISTKCKSIAITWFLATYAGIGFLLSKETLGLPFNRIIAVVILSFIGFLGNILLWHLDVNIYNKFWIAAFIEELVMEKKFDFLLQSKNINLLIDEDKAKIKSHGLLYLIINSILIITCGSFIISSLLKLNIWPLVFITLGLIAFITLSNYFIIHRNKKLKKIFEQILKTRKKNIQ